LGRGNRLPGHFRTAAVQVAAGFTASPGAECGLQGLSIAWYHLPEVFACQFAYGRRAVVFKQAMRLVPRRLAPLASPGSRPESE
jgi:hypothetical protein